MRTFTVRQLDREPGMVLDAADKQGTVRIKRRDGRIYCLQSEAMRKSKTELPDFAARRKKIFGECGPIFTKAESQLFDKLIAGE